MLIKKNFSSRVSNILSTFTKTKTELVNINEEMLVRSADHKIVIDRLENERTELQALEKSNNLVIDNINKILGDD